MIHPAPLSPIVFDGRTYVSSATTKGALNVLSLACNDVQGTTPAYLCPCTNGLIIPVVKDLGAQTVHNILLDTFLLIVSQSLRTTLVIRRALRTVSSSSTSKNISL